MMIGSGMPSSQSRIYGIAEPPLANIVAGQILAPRAWLQAMASIDDGNDMAALARPWLGGICG